MPLPSPSEALPPPGDGNGNKAGDLSPKRRRRCTSRRFAISTELG